MTTHTAPLGEPKDPPPERRGAVLVVEDDPLVQRALARLLRTAGYRARVFGSVGEFFASEPPAGPVCLVLDLHLPGGHGIDILDRLAEAGNPLPAVVLTGHGDVPSAVRAMKRGAVEFLEKPFDPSVLLAAVEAALARAAELGDARRRRRSIAERLDTLTPRESEVFLHVVAGWANKRIASGLGVAEHTVKVHRGRVMEKMAAGSLAELVRMAATLGIDGVKPP
ncbi:MAG: response regulator [Acidobacteriota bacterium]